MLPTAEPALHNEMARDFFVCPVASMSSRPDRMLERGYVPLVFAASQEKMSGLQPKRNPMQ
jgi:hypothetical protein